MNFGDLLTEVYDLGNDPGQVAWRNSVVARYLNGSLRRAGQITGDSARLSLALVQGQQEYALPTGVRRVKQVSIMPQEGVEPRYPIVETSIQKIPVITQTQKDPERYALQATGGANGQNFSLFMWPAPGRSAPDSIIIDIELAYEFTSTNPATAGELATELPFPPRRS